MYNYTDDTQQHGLDVPADVQLNTATHTVICSLIIIHHSHRGVPSARTH